MPYRRSWAGHLITTALVWSAGHGAALAQTPTAVPADAPVGTAQTETAGSDNTGSDEPAAEVPAPDGLPTTEQDAATPANPYAPDDAKKTTKAALTAWAAQQTPPCKLRAVARDGQDHLLACGEAGLWRVRQHEQGFTLVARETRGGNVVGFAKFRSELLVLVDLRVLQPLDGGTKVVTGNVSFVAGKERRSEGGTGENEWPVGKVVRTKGLRVELELTPHHQLSVGYRVAFRWQGTTVVGRIVHVDPQAAIVLIGMHEAAPPPGTPVEPTPEPSTAQVMSPRDGKYHYTLDVGARLGLSGDGIFGAEGGLQARFGNFVVSGEVRPFAFSTTGVAVLQAFVSMGVSTRWFGLTFGAGAGTVNRHDLNPPGTGILMTPALRFGTVDGFNVRARVNTTFHRQETHFSGFFMDAQIPVSRAYALLLAGGGGDVGIGEGEAGVRSLVHGNGGAGSWFLETTAGATVLQQNFPTLSAAAPHVRVALETRF